MSKWLRSNKKIGKMKAIRLNEQMGIGEPEEIEINGKYGFIWEYNKDYYSACVTSAIVAKKHLPKEMWPVHKSDETIIKFLKSDLYKWVKILKISKSQKVMINRANTFGKTTLNK